MYSGHIGISKTLKKIQTRFWWPKMMEDVQKYVKACNVCQRSKALPTQPGGFLQPLEILERKWECGSIDSLQKGCTGRINMYIGTIHVIHALSSHPLSSKLG